MDVNISIGKVPVNAFVSTSNVSGIGFAYQNTQPSKHESRLVRTELGQPSNLRRDIPSNVVLVQREGLWEEV